MTAAIQKKWTDEQLLAIHTTGTGLLVSAAAGSGKTSVLAERCAHLVCSAEPRCAVNQILAVTFTEAAAAEIKSRIGVALRERLAGSDDPHLRRQLALLEHANVSTLHSFCSRLIRQHFHRLETGEVDPNFAVLDEDESALMRLEVVRELFGDFYEDDADEIGGFGGFGRFVALYGASGDDRLMDMVVRMHGLLASTIDPEAWRAEALRRLDEAVARPLAESAMGREMLAMVSEEAAGLMDELTRTLEELRRLGGFDAYMRFLQPAEEGLTRLLAAAEKGDYEPIRLAAAISLGRLPTVKGANKDRAKALVDAFRHSLEKSAMRKLLLFSEQEHKDALAAVRPHLETLLSLIGEFDKRYAAKKRAGRAIDFSDLERLAFRLLAGELADGRPLPSDVARKCHRQFSHVLVDEFQDINPLQAAILRLVSTECLTTEPSPLQGEGGGSAQAETTGEGRSAPPSVGSASSTNSASVTSTLTRRPSDATLSLPGRGFNVSNLFRVGDVKQSIYRFRLADPHLFIALDAQLRDPAQTLGRVIDLQHNFRSRGPLLDAINAVFERLMTRAGGNIDYDESQRLRPLLDYPPADATAFGGAPVRLHILRDEDVESEESPESQSAADADELDRTEQEAALMAREIRAMMGLAPSTCTLPSPGTPGEGQGGGLGCGEGQGGGRRTVMQRQGAALVPRPIEYRDIVILMRSLRYKADRVADILRRLGVPVHCDAGLGYFASVEVRDILSVLQLLDNQRQDIAMAAVLRSPIALLPDPEDALARIAMRFRAQRPKPPFHEAVVKYAAEGNDELAARLRDLLATLQRWRRMARQRPLAEVLWRIYDESGYLAFCSGLDDGNQRVANLIELHRRAAQFGTFQRQGLYRFLRFLDSLEAQQDAARPSVLSEADNVVRIMTVHASKGLEFPVVLVPDLGKEHNMQATHGDVLVDRTSYVGLRVIDPERNIRYPSLGYLLVCERIRREALAEEIRLLYVAMTRAREHLVLFGTASPKSIERWQASPLPPAPGPLPARSIFSASTSLDWLGPLACAMQREGQPHFEVLVESPHDLNAELGARAKADLPAELQAYARLQPPASPPPASPLAAEIIARLCYQYPHRAYSELPAAVAATAVAHADSPPPVAATGSGDSYVWNDPLRPPGFLLKDIKPSAADRGVATHAVLAHLDFSRPCSADDLAAQVRRMLDRRLITPVQAGAVDLETIGWFLSTDLGRTLRDNAKSLLRELPLYAAIRPSRSPSPSPGTPGEGQSGAPPDPLDQQMIRGRLDLLLPLPAGALLLDYKTDRIPADRIAERAAWYEPQLRLYAAALTKAANLRITTAALVFLHPRSIWKVSL